MKKTAASIRVEFEQKLQNAIIKNGTIDIKNEEGIIIDLVNIAEPKGLYGVDEDTISKIEAILQSVEDGRVMVYCKEYGVTAFEFDFVGSKAACYKYLHQHEQQNTKRVAELFSNYIGEVPNILDDEPLTNDLDKRFIPDAGYRPYIVPIRNPNTGEYKGFEYKPHINLIDDASEQLSKSFGVSFMDARGAVEQALKAVEYIDHYKKRRDTATGKIPFEDVIQYATNILYPIPF